MIIEPLNKFMKMTEQEKLAYLKHLEKHRKDLESELGKVKAEILFIKPRI